VTPEEYEHHVAGVLRREGWEARVTPHQRDHGVDIVAERGRVRLAVQVKMFGGSNRPVAGKAVMELHGAAAFADCNKAMIATNGRLLPDAEAVAKKLGIEVRIIAAGKTAVAVAATGAPIATTTDSPVTFGAVCAITSCHLPGPR
jgi:restriction system protein